MDDLVRECTVSDGPSTGGQAFDTDHYNVLVREGCFPYIYDA